MPKVSVVLPVYNTSVYLREALDSVTRQTLQDIEIICVNDGSTDNSLDIIKEYADKDDRIVVINKPNGGYGHTMNVGMDAATGEYLGILETDDFLDLTMYEDLYALADRHHLDTVRGSFYRFKRNENGDTQLRYMVIDRNLGWLGRVFNPGEDISCMLVQLHNWAGIYRLSFLREHHIRYHESPGASFQDNGFFWQVQIYARRAMLLGKPYYYCRRDNPNSSVTDPHKIWAMIREFDFIRNFLQKDTDIWEKYRGYYWYIRIKNHDLTEKTVAPELKREFITFISTEYQTVLASNEISPKLFSAEEWSKIGCISRNPDAYIQKHILGGQMRDDMTAESIRLKKQLHRVLRADWLNRLILWGLKKSARLIRRVVRRP